ncbi:MAG: glycosyltransferase [Desulfovibrio sp.]|jgi:glycosyltransferase involved in cell wall biosynthesis|nr:glycosyltransferase [Desulfovibrio sp.]
MLLSLVTYTYNDHDFALDLLKTVPSFARPDEIVVVDDGSAVPFPAPEGVRVVRTESNRGPAQAKRLGIGAARGDVVLSLDCDIRPHRRWLHNALPLLADPKVALVGATIIPALADNYLSRALHRLARPARNNYSALFVSAGCWLFRGALWNAFGGLDGYGGATHEDAWFSVAAVRAGFTLIRANRYPVYEKRRLHRLQYWRRNMAYNLIGRFCAAIRNQDGRVAATLRGHLERALRYGRESGEMAFLYIELVKVIVFVAQAQEKAPHRAGMTEAGVAQSGNGRPPSGQLTSGGVIAAALRFFRPYPAVSALMREDLAALGFPLSGANAGVSSFPWLESIFAASLPAEALAELEASWPENLRREDMEKQYDFHYVTSGLVSGG